MNKSLLLYSIVFSYLFLSCNRNYDSEKIIVGNAIGTYYNVKYFGPDIDEGNIRKGLDSIIAKINLSLSTYQTNSVISKINTGNNQIVVDSLFYKTFVLSKKIHKKTQGYFDPTVGGLRNAYGFGDTEPLLKLNKSKIDSMMQYVGFNKVQLLSNGTVSKDHPRIYLDFNSIAKGFLVDEFSEFLLSKNINNFIVEIGGEVRTSGINLDRQSEWIIGLEDFRSNIDDRVVVNKIKLKNEAVAGSGNYRKNRRDSITGKLYVHTINPLTGHAEPNDVLSVHVLANSCAEADAFATAFLAMGSHKSIQLIPNLKDIDVQLIYVNNSNRIEIFNTEGFRNQLSD
jgi:thiamine biosynthesis lipoprotein